MRIFSAPQIREWDQYTITNEPVASVDLMERAASACVDWLISNYINRPGAFIFCGNGNNGGDGLAIARLLALKEWHVQVYQPVPGKRSADNEINRLRLQAMGIPVHEISSDEDIPVIPFQSIIIDALFGTGLNKPADGLAATLINRIKATKLQCISIDVPSGLFSDEPTQGNCIIQATHTLSFQTPKLGLLLAENAAFTGALNILDISLHRAFEIPSQSSLSFVDDDLIQSIYRPRTKSGHKYNFGHALLYAGSKQMMGAALLSAKACLRSGAGLVTLYTLQYLMPIVQTAIPEIIASDEPDMQVLHTRKAAIGIGPGMEINDANKIVLTQLLLHWKGPLVIDASALNLLQSLLHHLPVEENTPLVLTPHTGEFDRLFGNSNNDFERLQLAREKAHTLHCYIVLKAPHTIIACPDGTTYFNNTGNSGMATAGSGDVLTGIITGLLAQGYSAKDACILGVHLHGLAGDLAAAAQSKEAMIASDIIGQLGAAFQQLNKKSAAW